MSGRKQHYIPQSLLRGFQAKRSRKNVQVFVFKSGQAPYSANTTDVAAERYFYSELPTNNQEKTLDDLITNYENDLAQLLQQFRNTATNEPVDALLAAGLVTHLTVRGDFIRNVFGLGFQEIIAATSTLFSGTESVRSLLGIDDDQPTTILLEVLDNTLKALRSTLPSEIPDPLLKRIVLFQLREEFESIHAQHLSGLPPILNELVLQIPNLLRDSHVSVLEKSLAPETRVEALAHLNWTVIKVPEANLILPDCVTISVSGSENRWAPHVLESNAQDLQQVLLPISSSQLLVGRRDLDGSVTLEQFNRFAAACSAEFFVSSINTPEIASYSADIGKESKQSILSVAREAVENFGNTSRPESTAEELSDIPVSEKVTPNKTNITFPVSFIDSVDRARAEQITSVISTFVREFSKNMPLNRIESVTFTANYKEATQTTDKIFLATQLLEPIEEEHNLGVATAQVVLRDEKIMSCIIASSWLGQALLNTEDEDSFQMALHALGAMLAGTAFLELVDVALPEALTKPIADQWSADLFKHIYDACSSYFCARTSANFFPKMEDCYRNQLLIALMNTKEAIPIARLSYRHDGDLDSFLKIAIQNIGDALNRTASLIGHCDGLGVSILGEEGQMTQILSELGLEKWVYVYQRDLDKVFYRRGKWSDVSELTALNIHIERLLWQFSVFPWRMETGDTRVEIPLDVDMPELLKSGT